MSASASAPAQTSSHPHTFLAFDFGTRRIGVAVGNTLLRRAQPLSVLRHAGTPPWAAIAELVKHWQPQGLVVGLPLHPDGTAHEMTQKARRFARQLEGRFRLPVHAVDERYTSAQAASQGAHADTLDACAAAIILDQFLNPIAPPPTP
jgi:putative Holliday junction resolvase